MKVLFIGGTGIISSACSALAIERGFDLYLLNRGQSARPAPAGANLIHADIHDIQSIHTGLRGLAFDVVVNWIAFVPQQIERDLALFRGITGQYIFISSASAYQTPPTHLPVTESTPLDNPYWEYSRNKIACEERLIRAYREDRFPVTIVRPSHTYDKTLLPAHGDYTVLHRMLHGKPVIVHGDGTSIWTLTHHADFAKGFVGLLGHPGALGQAFHITSDEWLTWNQIFECLANAARVNPHLVHIPSEWIAAWDPVWGAGLLGDKAHSMIFDNRKIKRLVPDFNPVIPFAHGAVEIVNWYASNPSWQVVDPVFDAQLDRMVAAWETNKPPAL